MKHDTTKQNGRKRRSTRGDGRLYKRTGGRDYPPDSPVNAPYWLQYVIPHPDGEGRGKCVRMALKNANGDPITDRVTAEAERARIMAPFKARDNAEAQRQILARLQTAETAIAVADEEANPPLRIADAWAAFLASRRRPDSGPATLRQYEAEWDRFQEWQEREHKECTYLRDVTPEVANGYADDLTDAKVSASTYNQHIGLLRLAWRVLASEARTTANPWESIARKKLTALANRKRAVTSAQFDALLAATEADVDLHDLLLLLGWTGLRLVDGVCMRWGAVDFKRSVITLAPQKTERRQGKVVNIPMFSPVLDLLNRRQEGKVLTPAAAVFPDLAKAYLDSPASRADLSKRITAAFVKAGMVTAEQREGRQRAVVVYGAHSLRHHFVTAATEAGVPAAMIKSITGHATDAMLEHYQQIGADMAEKIAARIHSARPALPAAGAGKSAQPDLLSVPRAALQRILKALDAKKPEAARAGLLALLKKERAA